MVVESNAKDVIDARDDKAVIRLIRCDGGKSCSSCNRGRDDRDELDVKGLSNKITQSYLETISGPIRDIQQNLPDSYWWILWLISSKVVCK